MGLGWMEGCRGVTRGGKDVGVVIGAGGGTRWQ